MSGLCIRRPNCVPGPKSPATIVSSLDPLNHSRPHCDGHASRGCSRASRAAACRRESRPAGRRVLYCPWGRSIDRLRRAPAQSWRLGSRSLAFPVVPARSPADIALRPSKSDLAMDGRWASACCSNKDSCPRHHTERLAAQLSCSAPSVLLQINCQSIHVQQHH